MAVYQYECKTCKHEYEVTQPINDDKFTEHECDKCGSIQPCRRIITGSNFTLVGSGWAKDGYCDSATDMNYVKEMM